MRRIKQIMGILLLWALLIGIFQFMPIDIDGEKALAAAVQSSDNSLSSLSISPGTLSPAFQYNVVNYTASVEADVTSVEVNARLSNDTAVIESVSGNTDLQPGENLVSIVVKAQDGTAATYKIVVTRAEGENAADAAATEPQAEDAGADNPQGITIDGEPFNLSPTIAAELVPQDFTKETVSCQGQQVEGLSFDKSELTLVYLTTPSTEVKNMLAVYEEAGNSFYPFRKVPFNEADYLIILNPPQEAVPSGGYTQTAQAVGEYQNVPAYVKGDAEFSLLYGISSYGNKGWYQYDAAESTFQRYTPAEEEAQPIVPESGSEEGVSEPGAEMQSLQNAYTSLEEQYNKQKDSSRKTIAVLAFVIAVLLVVVVNLLLRGKKDTDELAEDFDYEELTEKVREQVKSVRKTRRGENGQGIRSSDDDQEDLWEDDTVPRAILKQQTKTIPEIDAEVQERSEQRAERKPGARADKKPERKQEAKKADRKPERKQEAKKADRKLERKQEVKADRRPEFVSERSSEPVSELDEDFEVIDLEDL